jgi:hypothetical protein
VPTPNAKRAEVARRRTLAAKMRLAGADWQTIADHLGYKSRGAACGDVGRAMAVNLAEQSTAVDELRAVEVMRLDRLQAAAWTAALDGDTKAIDTCVRIIAARSRLLGLDAPLRIMSIGLAEVDAEITRLAAELGEAA